MVVDQEVESVAGQVETDVVEPEDGRTEPKRDLLVPGLVLSVLGLSLMLFLGYVFGFTTLRETRAQHELLNVFTSQEAARPLSGKLPANGTPAAVLTIPRVGIHTVVIQGSTASDTARGPGLVTGTARPGTIGNAVIIGRQSTAGAPFGRLKELRAGNVVQLSSGLGKFRYVVTKTGVATPGEKSPASPVDEPQLTLITANAPLSSSDLYYVVARQITAPGADAKPKAKPPISALGTVGDSSRILPALLLGVLYVLCIIGTVVAYRRRRDQVIAIYVLTTPIILAVALWWFANLYLLLPSSF